jgi:Ca2+-binding EF-hand superfamily protein
MAKYDLNHDGKLDDAEMAVIQKDFAAAPTGSLARFDSDKDGKLSTAEMARMIPGSGRKSGTGEKSADKKDKAKADDAGQDAKTADGRK